MHSFKIRIFDHKQSGAALIVALFVTALVAVASVAMMTRFQIDIRRTELILNSIQANFYADGSIAWAKEELKSNWIRQKPNQVLDRTPIHSEKSKVDQVVISSSIYDPTGRFNLNSLTLPAYPELFERLITIVSPETDPKTAHDITVAAVNWVTPSNSSILDDFYSKQKPPYRVPHRLMSSVSELRLVKGVTSDLYKTLSPYITALPTPTLINVNSASIPILMSLSPSLTKESAKTLVAHRAQKPFATVEEFQQWDIVKNNPFDTEKITTMSVFFLVKTQVKIHEQDVILYTLLTRLLKNNAPVIQVMWQSKGSL